MELKKVKIIVTLGPATNDENSLRRMKDKGVDFVRINMSHYSIDHLKETIARVKKFGLNFIIDTEGSQIRTGELSSATIELEESDEVKIYNREITGTKDGLNLRPTHIVSQLETGDLIHIDFDDVTLCVTDTSQLSEGFIKTLALTGGTLGKNKAVNVDKVSTKSIELPPLSEKDEKSIQVGLDEGIGMIAASFMRSGASVDTVRRATQNTMQIVSKIECLDALRNLDDILKKSDFVLIDRGDLSREIPIEKIPFTQKIILNKARKYGTPVFVATNLLETMIEKRKPTRAEIHDIINTIVEGAYGLTLAAETAIGKYPMECINMLNNLIDHAQLAIDMDDFHDKEDKFVQKLEDNNYLFNFEISSSLIPPHGGKLVDRIVKKNLDPAYLGKLPKIKLDKNRQQDVEQIAIGTYSPLEGFMSSEDLHSVLDRMRLASGIIWPLPIWLDVSENEAATLALGKDVALTNDNGEVMALLRLTEKYHLDKKDMAQKMFNTHSDKHPGVKMVMSLAPVMLGGKITLLKRGSAEFKEYELTPRQTRKLFDGKGWAKVVAFHTRNVPHRGHEYIQLNAMKRANCDGLFIHPVVGQKKSGDFNARYIIKAYELMKKYYYPKGSVVFGTFPTYSRYAGPREAVFTALCRKNFGCSHLVVGRDHTGVGDFYHPKASHNIFELFPDLGIQAVKFDKIFYSKKEEKYIHESGIENRPEEDKLHISGTEARKIFESCQKPPEWFMRPKIAEMIVDAVKNGEDVFVEKEDNTFPKENGKTPKEKLITNH